MGYGPDSSAGYGTMIQGIILLLLLDYGGLGTDLDGFWGHFGRGVPGLTQREPKSSLFRESGHAGGRPGSPQEDARAD